MSSDARWSLLERARQLLLSAFLDRGVDRIEYVAAFPHFDDFAVWLCTVADAQRDSLRENPDMTPRPDDILVKPEVVEKVRRTLLQAGFTSEQLTGLVVVSQSQETVDREYECSWFFATR